DGAHRPGQVGHRVAIFGFFVKNHQTRDLQCDDKSALIGAHLPVHKHTHTFKDTRHTKTTKRTDRKPVTIQRSALRLQRRYNSSKWPKYGCETRMRLREREGAEGHADVRSRGAPSAA